MKTRNGFVSNSSSSSFIIINISDEPKTLIDFVKENPQLIEDFNEEYYSIGTQDELIKSAGDNNEYFKPHEVKYCIFGDEQGTLIGHVFDYILRSGGQSESFRWSFDSFLR